MRCTRNYHLCKPQLQVKAISQHRPEYRRDQIPTQTRQNGHAPSQHLGEAAREQQTLENQKYTQGQQHSHA